MPNTQILENPLSYCMTSDLERGFLHGSSSVTLGKDSKSCQDYMGEYCSAEWDNFCELASRDKSKFFPNNNTHFTGHQISGMTSGENLIRNTASKKYLKKMLNCQRVSRPFDPTVASSPSISYWSGNSCVPIYSVDATKIDSDVVMNKILEKPDIASDILINIFNTMKREGTLNTLKGTRLWEFYTKTPYFSDKF